MESVGGGNEGKKRRLPPWMIGGVSSNLNGRENKNDIVGNIKPNGVGSEVSVPKVKTRSRNAVKKILQEDEVSAPNTKTRSRKIVNESLEEDIEFHEVEDVNVIKINGRLKRGQKRTLRADEEANTDSSRVLVKCATVKRSRTFNSEVEEGNENLDRIAAPRKKNKVSLNKSMPKAVSSSCTGRELLMEDLISIAQEYVKAESLTEQQNQKVGASQTEEKLSAAAPFDEPTNGARTEPERMSSAIELKYYLPSSSSDQVQSNSTFSNTGDAAQDMLNLLLGPLLTKPAENITSTTSLNRDDMLFNRPVRNQNQYHNAEESSPPEKKKTSLKDKVAMFLD